MGDLCESQRFTVRREHVTSRESAHAELIAEFMEGQ